LIARSSVDPSASFGEAFELNRWFSRPDYP
jgi:hypothetical protein